MFSVDKFKLITEKETDDYGHFKLGPLPKGYGVSIANAYRRILLSSIEGAAVTSVKVKGAKHEYSTIPGVYDDVLTIILKLKRLSLQCFSDEPQVLKLEAKGEKVVKASDIELTSDVKLSNPDLVITELTESDAELEMEITVEKGAGFAHGDEKKRGQVGTIPLDANFSPVRRVVFDISKTRVGQQTDLDQIEIEIYTNGAVSPKEALDQASIIYHSVTSRLRAVITGVAVDEDDFKEIDETEVEEDNEEEEETSTELDIDKLNLSARLTNSLLKAGYKNLIELEGMSEEEIKDIRGLGQKSAEELTDIMKNYKLEVKTE